MRRRKVITYKMYLSAEREKSLNTSFARIRQGEYEFIAHLNVKTGSLKVLEGKNAKTLSYINKEYIKFDAFLSDVLPDFLDDDVIVNCIRALRIGRITSELQLSNEYVNHFAAKDIGDGHERTYRFWCGYVDDKKTTVLITCMTLQRTRDYSVLSGNMKRNSGNRRFGLPVNPPKRSILVADSSLMNRLVISSIFESDFNILEAETGDQAISLINKHKEEIALIVMGFEVADETRIDLIEQINDLKLKHIIPIIATVSNGFGDLQIKLFESGVADIVEKPFIPALVKKRAYNVIELYSAKKNVELSLQQHAQELMDMRHRVEQNSDLLINALGSVVEFRNLESGKHIERVSSITELLLKKWRSLNPEFDYSDDKIRQMARASTLHDLGKIAIPDKILMKPGRLTEEERSVIKQHPVLGCEILKRFKQEDNDFYRYCYDICRYHHERWDGGGYPDKLVGDQIPIWAQVVSIADVFEALVSPRVYKAAFPTDVAIKMIKDGQCGEFSPKLIECFEKSTDEILALIRSLSSER